MDLGDGSRTVVEPGLTRRQALSLFACAAALPVAAVSCGRGPAGSSVSTIQSPLHHSSLANVAKLIAAREFLSIDLTQQLLDRIAAVDGASSATSRS
jgi:hypothetical protein